jgi:hypothetical protein
MICFGLETLVQMTAWAASYLSLLRAIRLMGICQQEHVLWIRWIYGMICLPYAAPQGPRRVASEDG